MKSIFPRPEEKFDTYMKNMEGYFSQHSLINKEDIIYKMLGLEIEDEVEYEKITLYLNFINSLYSKGLDFSELHLEKLNGNYTDEVLYAEVKILNRDHNEYEVIYTIEINLKDKTKVELETSLFHEIGNDYYNEDEDYFCQSFFEEFNKFSYKNKSINNYYEKEKKSFKIFEKEFNYYMRKVLLILNIREESYSKNNYTSRINDKMWTIAPYSPIYFLSKEKYYIELNKFCENYKQKNDLDGRFINAINIYYEYVNKPWDISDNNNSKFIAVDIFKELADKQHPYSNLILGVLHFDGKYVLKSIEKSKYYLEKAYELGFKKQSIKVWNDFSYE